MKQIYILCLSLLTSAAFAQTYDFTIYTPENSGIVSNRVDDIKIDSNGALWLSTFFGVSTFNGTTWTNYTTSNSAIATNAILKIEIDGLNRKWMATQFNGIVMFNGTTWMNYTSQNSGLPADVIEDIAVDGANNLWVATAAGMTKFNGTTWTTYNALTNLSSIATDVNNGVWVTSGNVLYKFNGTDFNIITDGANKILKIKNGSIYVNSFDALMMADLSGTNFDFYFMNNSCLADCVFDALDVGPNDKVWIGFYQQCNNGGLQNFTDCTKYDMENSNLPDNTITAVTVQNANTIWVGTQEGGLVKMSQTLGVAEYESAKTSMFPNPANATVTFTNEASIEAISIVSLMGQQILQVTPNATESKIDVSSLAKGVYIVAITANGATTSQKLIVD